jgi:hypothetical protein
MNLDQVFNLTKIDPWFLVQIEEIVIHRGLDALAESCDLDADALRGLKRKGFSDRRIGTLVNASDETAVRERRHALGVRPVYKRVDTCAAEFATSTAYMYSTYEDECESRPSDGRRSWCSAAAQTASARASSSTTAACMPRWRCARTATRPSWSTAIRRPCRPTTTPRIASISSR